MATAVAKEAEEKEETRVQFACCYLHVIERHLVNVYVDISWWDAVKKSDAGRRPPTSMTHSCGALAQIDTCYV